MQEKVILPLSEDLLWDIIENGQKQPLIVDASKSFDNLQDKLLYYISNAELDVVLDWENCSFDSKSSIVESYFGLNRLYYNQTLVDTMFDLMMCYKQLPCQYIGIFDQDQCIEFINNHLALMEKTIAFLDSVILLACNGFAAVNKTFDPNCFQKVSDNSLSLNICYLFRIPEFVAYYSKLNFNNLKWYTIQFNEPIYNNELLHNIVFEQTSGLAVAICAVLKQKNLIKE